MNVTKHWVGVVSRDHVMIGVEGGFCQVNHGKEAPLRRMAKGDHMLYYSPRERIKDGEIIQAFTAVGTIIDDKGDTLILKQQPLNNLTKRTMFSKCSRYKREYIGYRLWIFPIYKRDVYRKYIIKPKDLQL